MPSSDECLRWCNPLVTVFETRLNNTLGAEWAYADVPGGLVAVAGLSTNATPDNSLVRISNGRAREAVTSNVVINGIQYDRKLSDPFAGGSEVSQSKMFINHRSGQDALHQRDWLQKAYTVKVGGRYKPRTAEDQNLGFSSYATWITGRTKAKDFDERQMGIFFDVSAPQLNNIFPEGKFSEARVRGQTKPFVIGHVRIMEPVAVSDTKGVYHDGECEGVVAAYDQDGTALTLEAGDPTTDTVSAADKYMADDQGNVAWHSDVESVRLEVKGIKVNGTWSDKANVLIAEVVKRVTSDTVAVNYDFDGKQIGWVFYDQALLKEQIQMLLDGLDCFYSEDEATNSITIRRRYNARYADLDGTANDRESFTFELGEGANFRQIKPEARPQSVTVRYSPNFSPLPFKDVTANRENLSTEWYSVSNAVFEGRDGEKVIDCALINESDAEEMADMATDRYALKSFRCSWYVEKIGHGVLEGDVGSVTHPLVKNNIYTEIRRVMVDTATNKTTFEGVMYG